MIPADQPTNIYQSPWRPRCHACDQPADWQINRVYFCDAHLPDWARKAGQEQEAERLAAEKRAEDKG